MADASAAQSAVPADPHAGSPPSPGEAECDLVMKGGITSGVVYPKLISQLASRYRFRNIGGTSAGAIAAGACAAAEHGRRHANLGAFAALEKLPGELGKPTGPAQRSKLFTLFQPAAALRAHFEVLVGALDAKAAEGARRIVVGMLEMHSGMVGAGLLVGALLLWPGLLALAPGVAPIVAFGTAALGTLVVAVALAYCARNPGLGLIAYAGAAVGTVAVLTLLLHALPGVDWSLRLVGIAAAMEVFALLQLAALLAIVVFRFGTTLIAGLHRNGYGLCSGRTADPATGALPGLTDWLTPYFDGLAGLPAGHRPLTFGDLWETDDPDGPHALNFEVMTSAISQNMVYGIPFRKGTPQFHYDPDEWQALFPPPVMEWLAAKPVAAPTADGGEPLPPGARVVNAAGKPLRALPRPADLPIVVAVRMSLSFPVLLSAVPLYSIDWSRTDHQATKKMLKEAAKSGAPTMADLVATRIWFSDGGIGSNMPLHMFDALLPGHPTFAVNLKAEHPDYRIQETERPENAAGRIYLPDDNTGGRIRYWPEPADKKPLAGLAGFLLGIVDTMQNWRDEILFPYPGFRDRIVQISQRPDEGGLNLNMPEKRITALAHAGDMAAGRLIDRFHPLGAEQGKGWSNHQTVRLGTFLGTVQPAIADLHPSLASGAWTAHLSGINGFRVDERKLALQFLQGLEALGAPGVAAGLSLASGALKPLAQIRIAPRI